MAFSSSLERITDSRLVVSCLLSFSILWWLENFSTWPQPIIIRTVELRYNEPRYNEDPVITNNI